MNNTQAIKKLQKLFGKQAAWRINEKAPRPEEREAVEQTIPELRAARDAAKERCEAKRLALLADPEYVQLCEQSAAARKALEEAQSICRHYRVTFGSMSSAAGMSFFNVRAEGDNWEDAFDRYEKKTNGAAP